MWEGTYFEWMSNIRDWCISRQIWWGHRIPVWNCEGCGKVIVSTDDPESCPECGGTSLRQEEDVLDTWFSSALWPFSTLGWPDDTEALKTFYPTTLLITGFDILFFWVARMMMMGIYIMKDVPFEDVYLHALVRDAEGDKMSKSKGNIIDPLEMIDKYGTDAFRFTLAAFTAQGRDVRMSGERIEGYQHFVTKIWNATRFSMMRLDGYPEEGVEPEKDDYSLCDRWIKDRLNKTIGDVTKYLDEYKFNDASGSIYRFIWHEFCDWYLELVKPVIYSKDDRAKRLAAQQTILMVLKDFMKLLHPFMPFLTEEIWQKLGGDGGSVMVSVFPTVDDDLRDQDAEKQMGVIMDVITSVRNIRGEMSIPPSKKLKVVVSAPDEELISVLSAGRDYIINLGNLEELTVRGEMEEPKGAATGVAGSVRVFALLEGTIDIASEKARLEKRITKIVKELTIVSKKLANSDFMEKAAEEVVTKEKAKFEELKEKQGVIEAALSRLEEIGA
jgi:valyl-tRNA synthetase